MAEVSEGWIEGFENVKPEHFQEGKVLLVRDPREPLANAVADASGPGLIDNSSGDPYEILEEAAPDLKAWAAAGGKPPERPVPKAFLTSKRQDYMAPPDFMASLRGEFNFVLDIAASAKSAQAPRFYTEADNAFAQDWAEDAKAGAYWANPPYGDKRNPKRPELRPLADWIFRAWWFRRRATGVWLLPANKTDQSWWHKLVIPYAEVRDVEGRIPFLDPDTGKKPISIRVNKDTGEEEEVVNGNSQASKLVIFGPAYGPGPLRSHKWRKQHVHPDQ